MGNFLLTWVVESRNYKQRLPRSGLENIQGSRKKTRGMAMVQENTDKIGSQMNTLKNAKGDEDNGHNQKNGLEFTKDWFIYAPWWTLQA